MYSWCGAGYCENRLIIAILMLENYVVKHKTCTFVPVFHGIRFKVRRLFVGMTDNFFILSPEMPLIPYIFNDRHLCFLPPRSKRLLRLLGTFFSPSAKKIVTLYITQHLPTMNDSLQYISVRGAKVNNLKDIYVDLSLINN